MRGITHTSRSDKTSVSFTWTAPPNGTGEVQFRFAVVQVVAIYWADQQSVTLQGMFVSSDQRSHSTYVTHGSDRTCISCMRTCIELLCRHEN